jgi:hypothetical protein
MEMLPQVTVRNLISVRGLYFIHKGQSGVEVRYSNNIRTVISEHNKRAR